jgi:hypothetical protein
LDAEFPSPVKVETETDSACRSEQDDQSDGQKPIFEVVHFQGESEIGLPAAQTGRIPPAPRCGVKLQMQAIEDFAGPSYLIIFD